MIASASTDKRMDAGMGLIFDVDGRYCAWLTQANGRGFSRIFVGSLLDICSGSREYINCCIACSAFAAAVLLHACKAAAMAAAAEANIRCTVCWSHVATHLNERHVLPT